MGGRSDPAPTPVNDNLLKIGDFARLAGTNLRTLRYYEELGLLHPARRSAGGFRYYRSTDANRLAMIRRLQDLGLQLDAIGELLAHPGATEDREAFVAGVRAALVRQDELLAERIAELSEQRERISRSVSKVTTCAVCDCTPTPGNNWCEPCPTTGEALPEPVSALFVADGTPEAPRGGERGAGTTG